MYNRILNLTGFLRPVCTKSIINDRHLQFFNKKEKNQFRQSKIYFTTIAAYVMHARIIQNWILFKFNAIQNLVSSREERITFGKIFFKSLLLYVSIHILSYIMLMRFVFAQDLFCYNKIFTITKQQQ